jgi:DNA-binding NtrC family response regulator
MKTIPSVLIIDDNPQVLKTLSQVLLALGVKNVTEAASGEAALEILAKRKFEVILADYRLEGMNGVEFIEKLRKSGDGTPVLLISGASNLEGIVRAFRQPNVDFFNKPFRMVELLGAMDRLTVARPQVDTRAVV